MSTELNEETYRRLKQDVEDARREAERAKGALEQLMKNLKEDFNCESLKDAKDHLATLAIETEGAQAKFEKLFKDYQKKWKQE